jgi:hypothetical protein
MNTEDRKAAIELLEAVENYVIAFVVTLLERRSGDRRAPVPVEVRERVIDTLAAAIARSDR